MGKKSRHKGTRTVSMMMTSRELRRHPEQVEQIRPGRVNLKNIMHRAYLSNGTRKSC